MANPNGNPQNLLPFKPGQSGNPGGKPVQSRNRLTGTFLAALADDFDEHGHAAIQSCRERSPGRYLALIASLLPKQLEITQDKLAEEMTSEELLAELAWTKERMLAQEQFEKDWYAAQASQSRIEAHGPAQSGAEVSSGNILGGVSSVSS
jgi:hypothetical protein